MEIRPLSPVAGVDYPRTFQEFDRWFDTEDACREYLLRLRWREGFCCPSCGGASQPWKTARGLLHCPHCNAQASVTAGTLFEGTRKPLRLWFLAIWFVTSQKHGASALGLQRVLGLGSYQTAWVWLHKLRRAMVRPGRDLLIGPVEVDESYIGATEQDAHGRKAPDKTIVIIAAERRGRVTGRIRIESIPDCSSRSLLPFVSNHVEPGSLIRTDGWFGYKGLLSMHFQHEVVKIRRAGRPAHELLPHVHRVASLLKRWLMGTHHGGVQPQHVDYYLDEFTFRFNRRTSRSRGLLFFRLTEQAVLTPPAPYKSLIGGGGNEADHNP
jgi:transposase-like protein